MAAPSDSLQFLGISLSPAVLQYIHLQIVPCSSTAAHQYKHLCFTLISCSVLQNITELEPDLRHLYNDLQSVCKYRVIPAE